MRRVELNLIAISACDSNPEHFVLVFEEEGGFRRLAIEIGKWEAQSIAMVLEGVLPDRPMTHDLMDQLLRTLKARLQHVVIYRVEEGVFYAHMVLEQGDEIVRVDARTSDAVAVALRAGCPIYAAEAVMEVASYTLDAPEQSFSRQTKSYEEYSISELERLLQLYVEREDFRTAARIRDIIHRKRGEQEGTDSDG